MSHTPPDTPEDEGPPPPPGAELPVLLVEDDRHIQRSIAFQLQHQGYKVICREDGESGLSEALRRNFSVVVLDVMLPKLDGLHLCQQLRQTRKDLPIIIISARGSDADKIAGLEYGADDYLAKPFSPAELEARIRALRRRSSPAGTEGAPVTRLGTIELDESRCQVTVDGVVVRLTPKEQALLRLLLKAPGRVFTRENLLAQVWGLAYDGYHRAVDAHIARLKAKLTEQLGEPPEWLETIYGVGYRVREPGSDPDEG